MNSSPPSIKREGASFWVALLPCAALIVFFGYMRLAVFQDRVFPLSSALPLLLCLWNRDLRLLYGMAAALTGITLAKVLVVMPDSPGNGEEAILLASQLVNIWLVAVVIHGLLVAREKIVRKNDELGLMNAELEASNEELAASNEELAAREEEISRQNEELQSQTEELEQQSEELRQQAEEMEQQSSELHGLNQELVRREKGLETLLNSGRWLRSDMSEAFAMSGVCQAGIQIMSEEAQAADVAACAGGRYEVWGDAGFGLQGRLESEMPFERSFAAVAIESGRTASITDIALRPDLKLPVPRVGHPFRSALAAPIWYEGKIVAALCFYSSMPRQWTEHDFSIAEWLASQAALALQSIRFQCELELKRRDAEDAAQQKSRFLAAISHDVRTPANAISLLAELIQSSASDPARVGEVPELAGNLWTNARLLVDLVGDVLDLTRLDSDSAELQVSEFALSELLSAEAAQARTLAAARKLPVSCQVPEEEIRLSTDRTKLSRIVSNLLGNAVKFTEKGEVRVSCEKAGEEVHIRISDTGCGIPEQSLKHVFDEFFQLRNPERDREKGTGLGLAICRRLANCLGAKIAVESVVGAGSTFTITLPLAPAAVKPPPAEAVAQDEAGPEDAEALRGMRILLVEDNDVARRAVTRLLEEEGAVVAAARTGREALGLLEEGEHQAILLDLNLPDMDGSEILQKLRIARPPTLERVLVITGDARHERVEQVMLLGADRLIAKPISLAKLRESLV